MCVQREGFTSPMTKRFAHHLVSSPQTKGQQSVNNHALVANYSYRVVNDREKICC